MPDRPPLVERKQRAARDRIVRAASELFAERGFVDVSVSDIADRAEVGRTTFFRHFGDKQEVVFAREQALLDAMTTDAIGTAVDGDRSVRSAVVAVQPLILQLCARITEDLDEYRRHERLVAEHVELRGRSAAKAFVIADRLRTLLMRRGWDDETARLAGHVAVACTTAARSSSDGAEHLVRDTRRAFERVLALGDPDTGP